MRLITGSILAALCALAQAQVAYEIDQKMDSWRAPYSTSATYALTVQMEGKNPTTGNFVVIGQQTKVGALNLLTDSVLFVDLVGPKTATVKPVVVSVRAILSIVTPGTGWTPEPVVVHAIAEKPFEMPLGQTLGCRYDMPSQTIDMLKTALTLTQTPPKISWGANAPGNLRCKIGMKAASIPGVIVAPPPPPPPTTVTVSQFNDCVAPVANVVCTDPLPQLIAADGAKWTIQNGRPFRNELDATRNGYTGITVLYVSAGGAIREVNPDHGYLCFIADQWAGSGPGC